MTHTVVILDNEFPNIDLETAELDAFDVDVITESAQDTDEIAQIVRRTEPDGLITQYHMIDECVFEAAPSLQVVRRYGVGLDTVDVDAATEHGVRVVNVPDYCMDEVSTHAFALLLSCERKTAFYDTMIENGTWDYKSGVPIHRLRGRTLGLVGFGDIPQHLAKKAQTFGLEVITYDPYVDDDILEEYGVEQVTFDALLDRSTYVSVHTPLTDETEHLFDEEAFASMDELAILVNTSRGAVVDTDALARALEAGEIRAAGIDVIPEEPPAESALIGRDDTVMTLHVAWYSEESIDNLRRDLAADVGRVVSGDEPVNPANTP